MSAETKKNNAFLAFVFIVSFFWLLLPEGVYITPFPFSKQAITLQSYADYLGYRLNFCAAAFVLWRYRIISADVFALFVLFLVDYVLTYNDPFLYYSNEWGVLTKSKPDGFYFPISYTMSALLYCVATIGERLVSMLRKV